MTETTAGDRQQRTAGGEVSERERYRLLADERRRVVADVLAEQSSPVTLGELATALEARDASRTEGVESPRTLEIQLHHVHLPMMDEAGVVDYDPGANRVEARQSKLDRLTTE